MKKCILIVFFACGLGATLVQGQGFNIERTYTDSVIQGLITEAVVSDGKHFYATCAYASFRHSRLAVIYKISNQGAIVDSFQLLSDSTVGYFPSWPYTNIFSSNDSLLTMIVHGRDTDGRLIDIMGLNSDSMSLLWQKRYRTDNPQEFIGTPISSACKIRGDSIALMSFRVNQTALISILGDSGKLARQFDVGVGNNSMKFKEMSFQKDSLWFLGNVDATDSTDFPCVMATDLHGNELYFYQFNTPGLIGQVRGLNVFSHHHFGFYSIHIEKIQPPFSSSPYDFEQGVLIEYDTISKVEKVHKIDSLRGNFSLFAASKGIGKDGFFVGTFDTYDTVTYTSTDYGIIAKTSMGQGERWTRRFRFAYEPTGPDTAFNNFRFTEVESLEDGGALAAGSFVSFYPAVNPQSGSVHAWVVRVDSFGCVVPGCQNTSPDNIDTDLPKARLLISLNPASDITYAHWLTEYPGEATFSLRDAQGRELRSWTSRQPEMTFVIPLEELASGVYYLSVLHHGKWLEAQKILKL